MKIIRGAPCGFYCVLTWHVLRNLRYWKEKMNQDINIQLGPDNIYFDLFRGKNVWEYYYNQIDPLNEFTEFIGERDMPQKLDLYEGKNIRETLGTLYDKYIHYNEYTQKIVDKTLNNLSPYNILGVHIRKTDKYNEDPESYPIDNKNTKKVIDKELLNGNYDKIYLATDDTETYEFFNSVYSNLLIKSNRIRGQGHNSIHHGYKNLSGYIKGLEAILDMEILAISKFLIRCTSNLSATSMILNQKLKCYNLNTIYRNDHREENSFNIYSEKYS